ncbi:ATP synthase F0 subunit 6 (mitochondrion) [Ramazzottius varieornatus]|uniref:ATP synthase subunit a n=1 Tax=Ramazzottius varieornatus TaxID=947166 RepID=A0A1C9ZW69_RAMVA|nr:ATP synthase F0 subunit 6 [Ramazzottius varieornatus]BAV58164.1 ATP synthase F0 subunit 6 [Ramazzottius varieornatus]
MMTSLFSSFDPMSGFFSMNYLSFLTLLMSPICMDFMFLQKSRNKFINLDMYASIESELKSTISNSFKKGKTNILMGVFFSLLLMNLAGLVPYVFTSTAHMTVTLSMTLPFWLGFISFSLINNTNHFFSHLVPLSTPLPLSQFMVIIESVSQLIRPITLSVRLAANMTAGHILMGLASSNVTMLNLSSSILIMLIILETAVAFIQSYVFTILISMYMNEA